MFRKIFAIAVTSGLAAQALRLWMNREKSRQQAGKAGVPAPEVQRWEDEGGSPAPAPGRAG